MFVIPCKYKTGFPFVITLCEEIRKFHPSEKICVVDSDSSDKSYFSALYDLGVIVEDVANKNWMIGAYWHGYERFPDEEYYYFLHDSMRVKSNLDYLKEIDVVNLMYFDRRVGNFNDWGEKINQETKYKYNYDGFGILGPIFFCKNKVIKKMKEQGANKILPTSKQETGYCEGSYGFFLEDQGYDMIEYSLFGNVFENESPTGKSGLAPHYTEWQFPVEKFYAYNAYPDRL